MTTLSRLHDENLIRAGVAIRLQGATARYGAHPALLETAFEAHAGEAHVITGPAGAGKTTLISVLALRRRLDEGVYDLLGANTAKLRPKRLQRFRRRIGVVEESPAFIEHLSVFENVALPLRLAGGHPREFGPDVEELLAFVGASPFGAAPVEALSAAERRLAAVARALAGKPDVILADDPVAGMAPELAGRVLRILTEMRRVGAAVVITSPDPRCAEALSVVRWRLLHGRIRAQTEAEQ